MIEKTILTIELVPSSTWYNNVRSAVTPAEWDKIRRQVYRQANNKCEICGGKGPKWPVECHEVWEYDDEANTQTLVKMIALCPNCHAVKHIGRTSVSGDLEAAIKHLCTVNGWSRNEAKMYIEASFEVWAMRSNKEWTVNIQALNDYGVVPKARE
jgi:hypothetical protein